MAGLALIISTGANFVMVIPFLPIFRSPRLFWRERSQKKNTKKNKKIPNKERLFLKLRTNGYKERNNVRKTDLNLLFNLFTHKF
jgi:hypothetical protein